MVMIICSQSYRDWVAPGTQKEIKYIICLKKKNLPNLPQKKTTTTTPTIFRQSNLNVPCASNTTMPKGSFLLGTITASQDLKSAWSKGPHAGSCLTWPCGSKFGNVRFLQKMSIFTISYQRDLSLMKHWKFFPTPFSPSRYESPSSVSYRS